MPVAMLALSFLRKNGWFGCFGTGVLLIGAIIAIILIAGPQLGTILGVLADSEASARVVTSQTIFENIATAGRSRLETQELQLTKHDVEVSIGGCFLDTCFHRIHYSVNGAVEAGIDFQTFGPEDVQVSNDVISVTLPAPNLTGCRLDNIIEQSWEGNGTQINRNVGAQIARYTVITEWREEAIESGILERARDDARRTITQLLRGLSANENQTVEIIFDETQQSPMHPSCASPALPEDYIWDASTDKWIPKE